MNRSRAAGRRRTERLTDHVREPGDVVHCGVELRHMFEGGHVVDLLVHPLEFQTRMSAPGQRDHRRVRQMRVPQAGREVHRTDHLGRAHARTARHSRVTVGHIGRRLLAMCVDPDDVRPPFHLHQREVEDGRDHEEVSDAVGGQHLRQHLGACPHAWRIRHNLAPLPAAVFIPQAERLSSPNFIHAFRGV